jgi:hypothetical protein
MEKTEKKPPFVIVKKETQKETENRPKKIDPAVSKFENKHKKGPFSMFFGKKITIQAARSSVLYIGELIDYADGFLVLKNAKIIGTKHTVEVDTLFVNKNLISHLHTEPKTVEEKTTTQNTPQQK